LFTDGRRLEEDEVRDVYLEAVRAGLEAAGVERLQVCGLEDHGDAPGSLTEGQWLPVSEAVEICRALLREAGFWCRLEDGDRAYVHVGYDYYLYLGTPVDVGAALAPLEEAGLFVEAGFSSPYAE
jgi:small subunit ribosomal protein S1